MKKVMLLATALILALTAVSAFAESATLSVRGTGVVTLDADTATVMLGVREVSAELADAQASVNARIDAVIERLRGMGVAAEDIHTNYISVYPNYDYDSLNTPIVGYSAENNITVSTRDIDNIGSYIDAAFEAGANIFNDISFSASDTADENSAALVCAVKNANDKAGTLAEAAGMRLGKVVSITEAEYSYAGEGALYARSESADAGAGTPVYASELQLSASVVVVYELVEAD